MLSRPPVPEGPLLVVGLARSGVAAALALRAARAAVVGCDAGNVADEARRELERAGVAVHAATEGVDLLAGARTVVKSPGVPQEAPVVEAARKLGRPVVGELEIAWRLLANEFIGVTGSNGKTTTTELIGHIHREAGLPVAVAGNVGTALASLVGAIDPAATVVCEASSFQLEDTEAFAPEAGVLLNLTEDHLDRHGTMEAYAQAKLRMFANQPEQAVAVLPQDLDIGPVPGRAARVRFGVVASPPGTEPDPPAAAAPGSAAAGSASPPDLTDRDGGLWWHDTPLIDVAEIRLRGAHNRQNAMAAAAVTLARGVDPAAVRSGLATFRGVAHRLEEVATVRGVLYVNDSKATNVASAAIGIASFEGGVHAILGGRGKGGDYEPLAEPVAEHCVAAYLVGETAAEIRAALAPTGVPIHDCGDLDRAMAAARAAARPGEVVLLSPACASYDQYTSFEERGEHFRALATGAA